MKVVGRILYAMLAVFAFWFALNYAQGRMQFLYFDKYGNEAITYENDAFFYGSGRDYRSDLTLFETEGNGYQISFYEAADVKESSDSIEVSTYVNAILKSDMPIEQNYYITFSNDNEELSLQFFQFQGLEISMLLNENNDAYGILSSLLVNGYDQFDLYDEDDNLLWTSTFEILGSQFILEDELITYYDAFGTLPLTELTDQHVYPKYTHSTKEFISVLYISLA
ncbi:MAG: hypothetical protein WCR19_06420, partial [Acholeplasmataceae bacterium]